MRSRKRAQQKPPPGIVWIEDYVDPDTAAVTPGIASRVGVTPGTYRKWRMQAKGPRTFMLGKRVAAYVTEIDTWIATQADLQHQGIQHEMRPAEPRISHRPRQAALATAAA